MGRQEMPGQGMPPSYAPYQHYGYSQAQPQQPAPGPYGYAPSQPQQGVPNAYGAPQPGQGIPNAYGTPQPQPAPGPYGYRQSQPSPGPYGYGQPQQTGYQRPQAYPPYQGTMVPQPGPQEPPAPLPPKKPRKPVNVDGLTRLTVFLALPLLVVLFVLSMVFGTQVWLKWAFAVPALLVILALWIRPIVTSDLKLTISFVMGAMIVVAVVSALSGTPQDNSLPPTGGGQNVQANPSAEETPAPQLVDVPQTQPDIPAPTDPPQVSSGLESDAARQLISFLHLWQSNDADQMLALCAPSWVNKQALPHNSIFSIMTNRTPVDWELMDITGTDNDSSRTITLTINIDRNNGREPRKYRFRVIMLKENDNWYVDPDSLDTNEPEATSTPESAFITQPPQPAPASGSNQVLYYNARGGSKYHLDPDCSEVGKQFKPMTAITYGDLFTDDYDELMACNVCGAPLKEN